MSAESLEAMALRATIDWLDEKPVTPWWDRIVKINPVYGEAYAIAARFFVLNRRYEEAIRFYQKAVELNPRLWEARSLLGLNLMRLGRDQEARRQLELCYDNGYQSDATVNSLRLLDSYQNFAFVKTAAGVLKLHQKEAAVLEPYFASELARAVATFERKYRMKLEQPVRVEVYPDHEDFAVRTLGMPGLGALGVSFGLAVAMDSPSGRRPGQYHWASTLWHELSHVFVLTATRHHVPRWFTEGLAVYEETAVAPDWGDRLSPDVILAIREKKLLPVVELDRGFVRPSYPAQVPVSYFQAGRICAYIAQKWGYDKLLAMVQAYAQRMSTKDAIQQVLGVPPAELDRQFLAWLEAETRTTVAGFEDWRKRIRALNEAAQAGRHDAVTRDGPAVRDLYPEYVEAGSAYELLAEAHLAQGNKAAATAELGRYAAVGGREPVLIKKLAALLEELGRAKDAAQAWNRLNWVYPHDEEVHRKLGDLLLAEGDASGAIRELRTVIALKPQDPAAAHFNLARAYRQASRLEDARDEILLALEAAPGYRPAQKMLLELAEGGTVTRGGRAKE
jgi:tetratricopeptide (TPR) repeat protein